MQRKPATPHAALLLALTLGALGAMAPRAADPPKPSLLLITLDTTRADHLGCYGARGVETPVLDGLASGAPSSRRPTRTCP